MATYAPSSLGIKAPPGGFQQGGWYNGRQYWGGTLSEPNQIHPSSNQQGAGQQVSQEVVGQSAAAQGKTPEQFNAYFQQEQQRAAQTGAKPTASTGTAGKPYSAGASGMPSGAGAMPQQPTLNLPNLYNTLYASSGITDLEKELSEKERIYNETTAKIKDNPYLSEATLTGRLKKLSDAHQASIANLQRDIATKKADIETRLNLETKQFDINSQAAQQALSQFNTLLQMGALSGATGEDIANITRSTGISSEAIQAAIDASQKKDVKTQVITSTNDAGVVTATVINTETGEIIAKNNLGSIGNAQNVSAPKATEGTSQQEVAQIISSYSTNEQYQARISPEDLYTQLLLKYPLASGYIKDNWQPEDIRAITQ